MTWNYRVVSLTHETGSWLEILEVYYTNGEPTSYGGPMAIMGETVEELREVYAKVGKALDKPVLMASEIEAGGR